MAITKVDVQGIKVTVDGDILGCLQSIGSIEETRTVKEYSCMTSNDTVKSLGSISRGPLNLSVLLDPDATTDGQKTLDDAFTANTTVQIVIELNNKVTTTGTQYTFSAAVSKRTKSFPKDEAVLLDFTVEVASDITITPAA